MFLTNTLLLRSFLEDIRNKENIPNTEIDPNTFSQGMKLCFLVINNVS